MDPGMHELVKTDRQLADVHGGALLLAANSTEMRTLWI